MRAAVHVGPADRQLDGLVERDLCHFQRDAVDRLSGHAALGGDGFRRITIVEITLGDQGKYGLGAPAVGQVHGREQGRRDVGQMAIGEASVGRVPDERIAVTVARKQAIAGHPGGLHHQPRRIGVFDQEFPVDQAAFDEHVDERESEKPVGARPDRDPFVGDRGVAGAHRIDRDEFRAAPLQLVQPDLDRVG